MANRIEVQENISTSRFVDPASRYLSSQVIHYGDERAIAFTTYKRQPKVRSASDQYYIITGATQYRPDKVAYAKYGISHWWWRIMEYNDIFDIFDFTSGRTILLPGSL